jgi:hypothetical protein
MSVHLSSGIDAHTAAGVGYSTFFKCLNLHFLLSVELPWQQYIIVMSHDSLNGRPIYVQEKPIVLKKLKTPSLSIKGCV